MDLVLRAVARAPVRVLGRAVASEGAGPGDVTGLPRLAAWAFAAGDRAPRWYPRPTDRTRRRGAWKAAARERVEGEQSPAPPGRSILHLTRVQRRPAVGWLG